MELTGSERKNTSRTDFNTAISSVVNEIRQLRLEDRNVANAPRTTKSKASAKSDFKTSLDQVVDDMRKMRFKGDVANKEHVSKVIAKSKGSRSLMNQVVNEMRQLRAYEGSDDESSILSTGFRTFATDRIIMPSIRNKRISNSSCDGMDYGPSSSRNSCYRDDVKVTDKVDVLIFDACNADKELLRVLGERWNELKYPIRGFVLSNWNKRRNGRTAFNDEIYKTVQVIVNVYNDRRLVNRRTIETDDGSSSDGNYCQDDDFRHPVDRREQMDRGSIPSKFRRQSFNADALLQETTERVVKRDDDNDNNDKNDVLLSDSPSIDDNIGDESLERKVREMMNTPGIPAVPRTLRNRMHLEDSVSSMLLDSDDDGQKIRRESNNNNDQEDRLTDYSGFMRNVKKGQRASTSLADTKEAFSCPRRVSNNFENNSQYPELPTMKDLLDKGLIDRPFQYDRSSVSSSESRNTEEFLNVDENYETFKKRLHEVIDNAGKYSNSNDDYQYCGEIEGNTNDGIPIDRALPPTCTLKPAVKQRSQRASDDSVQQYPTTRSVSSGRSSVGSKRNGRTTSSVNGRRNRSGSNIDIKPGTTQKYYPKRINGISFDGGRSNRSDLSSDPSKSPSVENLKQRLQRVKDSIQQCPIDSQSVSFKHRANKSASIKGERNEANNKSSKYYEKKTEMKNSTVRRPKPVVYSKSQCPSSCQPSVRNRSASFGRSSSLERASEKPSGIILSGRRPSGKSTYVDDRRDRRAFKCVNTIRDGKVIEKSSSGSAGNKSSYWTRQQPHSRTVGRDAENIGENRTNKKRCKSATMILNSCSIRKRDDDTDASLTYYPRNLPNVSVDENEFYYAKIAQSPSSSRDRLDTIGTSFMDSVTTSCSDENFEDSRSQEWWKYMPIYNVHPKSFKDTNGDEIGDFNGKFNLTLLRGA